MCVRVPGSTPVRLWMSSYLLRYFCQVAGNLAQVGFWHEGSRARRQCHFTSLPPDTETTVENRIPYLRTSPSVQPAYCASDLGLSYSAPHLGKVCYIGSRRCPLKWTRVSLYQLLF